MAVQVTKFKTKFYNCIWSLLQILMSAWGQTMAVSTCAWTLLDLTSATVQRAMSWILMAALAEVHSNVWNCLYFGSICLSDVDECKTSMHECAQNCLNTEGSYLCSCRDSYVLNEDGLNCDVSCSGTFTDLFGFFNTPDWPDSYPSVDFSCVWEIVIDIPDASIVIQFNEPYGIHGSEPCESDYVEVLHGVGSNTTSLGKNCGTDVPGNIAVESNRATVVFRGSVSSLMDKPGVSISYKAVVEGCVSISIKIICLSLKHIFHSYSYWLSLCFMSMHRFAFHFSRCGWHSNTPTKCGWWSVWCDCCD